MSDGVLCYPLLFITNAMWITYTFNFLSQKNELRFYRPRTVGRRGAGPNVIKYVTESLLT